jgi:hypothetical protein
LLSAGVLRTPSFLVRGKELRGRHIEIACSQATSGACPQGAKLVFSAATGDQPMYLMAYAEPVNGGERIWYFPADIEALPVARSASLGDPLERAIELGPEHRPGKYLAHVLLSPRRLQRSEILRGLFAPDVLSESIPFEVAPK